MRFLKTGAVLSAAVMLLCSCSRKEGSAEGIAAAYDAANFEKGFADCISAYFEAVQNKDFIAYKQTVYAPYAEVYGNYLESKGKTLEASFASMADQFNEDGYESWDFTEIQLNYHPNEDVDDFFETWVEIGVFDEQFAEDCKAEAIAIRDVEFTLFALYKGDKAAVPVVQGGEMIMIQTEKGYFLFG